MDRVQQIEPITTMQKTPTAVLALLRNGPVILAQRSRPTAVLVSVEEWDQLADELATLRLAAEARRIKAENDANGTWVSSKAMRERMAAHGVVVG
ncbi:MAG: type II toxin-antitoxin system prevent-host-death family antitoxin [Caldilineaceae bacterium]|jgi:PHD/YefM family antitoxin component YafN of YafNO toxin-antitoxin module